MCRDVAVRRSLYLGHGCVQFCLMLGLLLDFVQFCVLLELLLGVLDIARFYDPEKLVVQRTSSRSTL